jgi:imidazolonepropionase-like amidohydrolase
MRRQALGLAIPLFLLAPADGLIAIRAHRLIDGSGGAPLSPAVVIVRGERIASVGKDVAIPARATVIDLGRATLLPGLVDLHTHLTGGAVHWEDALVKTTPSSAALYGARNALDTLRAGFTTCRDMGPEWPYVDVDLRRAIDEGVVPGPRLQVAGNYVSATGGAGDARQFSIYVDVPLVQNLADGVDAVRRAVRTNFKNGADFIKILATGAVLSKGIEPGAQQYSDEELRVAVEEATRWGRPVAAHAHGAQGIKTAIRAGVRTIDHGSMLDDEGIELLKARPQTFYVPTLYVGEAVVNEGEELGIPASEIERSRKMSEYRNQTFRRALAAGIPIAFGTDAGVFPHGLNARELTLRVREGEAPMQAIVSATKLSARVMGWEDRIGTVESGKYADLIAVEEDPLSDISVLERVSWVMKGGGVYRDEIGKERTR